MTDDLQKLHEAAFKAMKARQDTPATENQLPGLKVLGVAIAALRAAEKAAKNRAKEGLGKS